MTVNAVKGHEFDVAVLFVLNTLAESPAPGSDPDPKHGRWGNAGLVGMTRTRDLLLITWTKHNTLTSSAFAISRGRDPQHHVAYVARGLQVGGIHGQAVGDG